MVEEMGGVFSALRELFLQRKVDMVSLLQLWKKKVRNPPFIRKLATLSK